ncbi:hypothetical protein BJX70DRAFT_396342 [Aspergillus crustosus]
MYIISPLSNCVSPEKRNRFLDYISKIAPVTLAHEPKCRAYAWFRSAEDNDTVPHHWLRGFEVQVIHIIHSSTPRYEDIEANTITHRASDEYKAFRGAVGEEGLLARPSDLRYWRPSGVGFLTRADSATNTANFISRADIEGARQYIVVDELTPRPGQVESILRQLGELAEVAERETLTQVLSFWVLRREDDLLVFSRYEDKDAFTGFSGQSTVVRAWEATSALLDSQRRTTWIESGIGFLDR